MRRKQSRHSALQRALMFSVAVLALIGGYFWGNQHAPNHSFRIFQQLEQPITIEPFQLKNHQGDPFTQREFQEHWNICLFGYTSDIEAAKSIMGLAVRTYNRLAATPELQQKFQTVFITIDPERDTQEKLQTFISHYGKEFQALSGEKQQIDHLARQLGVQYQVQARQNESYVITHSTSLGVINPQGELVGLFTGLVDAGSIAADIQQLAGFSEK